MIKERFKRKTKPILISENIIWKSRPLTHENSQNTKRQTWKTAQMEKEPDSRLLTTYRASPSTDSLSSCVLQVFLINLPSALMKTKADSGNT